MSDSPISPAIGDGAYDALLTDLRAIITTGRVRAAVAVNAELVMTYWKIGEAGVGKGARGQYREVLERIKVAHVPASRQPGGAEGAPGPTQRRL